MKSVLKLGSALAVILVLTGCMTNPNRQQVYYQPQPTHYIVTNPGEYPQYYQGQYYQVQPQYNGYNNSYYYVNSNRYNNNNNWYNQNNGAMPRNRS